MRASVVRIDELADAPEAGLLERSQRRDVLRVGIRDARVRRLHRQNHLVDETLEDLSAEASSDEILLGEKEIDAGNAGQSCNGRRSSSVSLRKSMVN